MRITLEMVDEVINRTNVSYKVAKEALELNEGDVLKAIVHIEESKSTDHKQNRRLNGQEIVERLKALVNDGLVHQILILKNGRTVVDIPIVAGAVSAVIFTIPTVAGIIAAIATGCEIKIVKKDGGTINFNELTQEKFEEFMAYLKREENKDKNQDDSEN
jgi:hypothetical protein